MLSCLLLTGTASLWAFPSYCRMVRATESWQDMRLWYRAEDYWTVAEEYAPLYEELRRNPDYLFEYGRSLHKTGQYAKSDEVLAMGPYVSGDPMFYSVRGNNAKAAGRYGEAEYYYRHAFKMLPNRLYPLYLLAVLYHEQGKEEAFARTARAVEAFQSKVDSPATRRLKQEIRELKENIESNERDNEKDNEKDNR